MPLVSNDQTWKPTVPSLRSAVFEYSDNFIELDVGFSEAFNPSEVESFKVSVMQAYPTVIKVMDLTEFFKNMTKNNMKAQFQLEDVYKKVPNGGLMNLIFTMHLKNGKDNLQSKKIFLKPLNVI